MQIPALQTNFLPICLCPLDSLFVVFLPLDVSVPNCTQPALVERERGDRNELQRYFIIHETYPSHSKTIEGSVINRYRGKVSWVTSGHRETPIRESQFFLVRVSPLHLRGLTHLRGPTQGSNFWVCWCAYLLLDFYIPSLSAAS